MISFRKLVFSLCIAVCLSSCGEDPVKTTEAVTGTIEGVVFDFASGDAVGNALIVTKPPSSSVTSDTLEGAFQILHVEPGIYHVRAEKYGYDSSGVDISVIAGDKTIADIALKADTTQTR